MMKERKSLGFVQQEERGNERPITDGDVNRLRSAQRLMDEVASRIPPLSPEQIHSVVESDRLPQFQLRRQADRWLLTLCILLLTLVAGLLWHHASDGLSPLNIAFLIFSAADLGVVLRATYSLWLMRQTLRLRATPLRMARYTDRLNRLTHRRRRWIDLVLRSHEVALLCQVSYRIEKAFHRIPSPAFVTACLALLVVITAWLVLGSHHSDGDSLLASSHTPQPAVISMPVPPADDAQSTIVPIQQMSAPTVHKASLGSAQLNPEKSQLDEEPQTELSPSRMSEYATKDEELLAMEEEQMTEPFKLPTDSHLAATEVLCNRGDCSEQQYYEIFCAIVMNNN